MASSDPSLQSAPPSHRHRLGMQRPSLHVNSSEAHVTTAARPCNRVPIWCFFPSVMHDSESRARVKRLLPKGRGGEKWSLGRDQDKKREGNRQRRSGQEDKERRIDVSCCFLRSSGSNHRLASRTKGTEKDGRELTTVALVTAVAAVVLLITEPALGDALSAATGKLLLVARSIRCL